jgi:hypothetical protein
MHGGQGVAEYTRVRKRAVLVVLVGAVTVAALGGASPQASAGRACIAGAHAGGYSYAGHQEAHRGHGVRATISITSAPSVHAGHVAGWVGVGGPGQGTNGSDEWIQAGIAAMPGGRPFLYTEITRPDGETRFVLIEKRVELGEPHDVAVLETAGHRGAWRVWVDGRAVTDPILLRGSSGRWAPIVTAESWNARSAACNSFGFRFEDVAVSAGAGGSWRAFVPGHRFLDGAHTVRDLTAARATTSDVRFAFLAASS